MQRNSNNESLGIMNQNTENASLIAHEETPFYEAIDDVNGQDNNRHHSSSTPSSSSYLEVKQESESPASQDQRYGWFTLRPSLLQFLNNPKGALVWVCLFALTQSYVTSGLVFTDTTTLERRFGLSSLHTGFLASVYDIALIVVILPVTYFGERGNKPLWLGNGALIFAFGSFLFAVPQYTAGLYEPSTLFADTCDPEANRTDLCSATEEGLDYYYWVFVAAQCLHGLGAAPIYTLGVTYLDESVAPHVSSIYLGIVQSTSILGPALGYLLGGYYLSIYVDPWIDPESLGLTPDSLLWVGAWWIGFLTSGAMALVVFVPLLGFPKFLPGAKNLDGSLDKFQTQKGTHFVAKDDGLANSIRDIPRATVNLVTNAPFMLLNCAAASEWFIITSLAVFGPKYLESQFYLTTTDAAFQTGLIVIPSSCVGTLIGAYIVNHYKMSFKGMVKFCLGSLVISFVCFSVFSVSCPNLDMAGVTVQYINTSVPFADDSGPMLTSWCNTDCHCTDVFNPVCGSDMVAYYSACYAGCTVDADGEDSERVYGECACIQTNATEGAGNATLGLCPQEECNERTALFIGLFISLAFTFLALVPSILATMRAVSHSQRAFGLGMQSVIYRGLGSVPGPIILGALIDKVCLVWETSCDGSGNCWLYDNETFSRIILIVCLVLRSLTLIFLLLALVCYKPSGMDDDEDGEEEGMIEEEGEKGEYGAIVRGEENIAVVREDGTDNEEEKGHSTKSIEEEVTRAGHHQASIHHEGPSSHNDASDIR